MWQRARGTFRYPEYDSGGKEIGAREGGQGTGGGGGSELDANNLKRHESKMDERARTR